MTKISIVQGVQRVETLKKGLSKPENVVQLISN